MSAHDASRIVPLRRAPTRSARHAELDRNFHDTQPQTWPRCSGACNQGRRLCVTPEACRLPERRAHRRQFQAVRPRFIAALIVAVVLGCLAWWGLH